MSDGGQKAQLRLRLRHQTGAGADLQRGSLRPTTIRLACGTTDGTGAPHPHPPPPPWTHLFFSSQMKTAGTSITTA